MSLWELHEGQDITISWEIDDKAVSRNHSFGLWRAFKGKPTTKI